MEKTNETLQVENYSPAFAVHARIKAAGELAMAGLMDLGKALQEMRENKYYSEFGYESFEAYTETEFKMSLRNAQRYIRAYDTYKDAMPAAQLGIKKLLLLASVDEEQREEFVRDNDVESMTAAELKKALDTISDKERQISDLLVQLDDARDPGVAPKPGTTAFKEMERLKTEKTEALSRADRLADEKKKLAAEIESLKKAAAEPLIGENDESKAALAELENRLAQTEAALQTAQKQLTVAGDVNLTKFKILFEEFQEKGIALRSLLALLDDATRARCAAALKKVLEGWTV